MNFYIYKITIFNDSFSSLEKKKEETWTAIAESKEEAQRQIIDKFFDPNAEHANDNSSHIVFTDEPYLEYEVFWDPTLNNGKGDWNWVNI